MPWGGHSRPPPEGWVPPAPSADDPAQRLDAPLPIGGVPLPLAGPFADGLARLEAVLVPDGSAPVAAPLTGIAPPSDFRED
eukprot:8633112-Alexandrium_andersonii.AAC.1